MLNNWNDNLQSSFINWKWIRVTIIRNNYGQGYVLYIIGIKSNWSFSVNIIPNNSSSKTEWHNHSTIITAVEFYLLYSRITGTFQENEQRLLYEVHCTQ